MDEMIEKLFGKSTRVLVKDGEFNEVQGSYHHYDYSQRITNNGSYNIIGNTIHNVSNICPQVIYHDSRRSSRSMRHGRFASSSVAATVVASDDSDAPPPYQKPQSQVPILNNPNPLPFSPLAPPRQIPGQYIYTESGDVRPMSAGQSAFMQSQMAYMKQELDSEFGEDNGDTSDDDDMSATTRSQSLSADFNRLTIAGVSSLSQSTVIHGSSSSTVRADIVTPRHIIIPGDHTEVDNNFYQTNFDSNKEQNNIIENSFGEGKQENIGVWRMLVQTRPKSKQAHNPRRR